MIYTKQQAIILESRLQSLLDAIYKNKNTVKLFEKNLDEDEFEFFTHLNNIKNIETLSKKDLQVAIKKTIDHIRSLPTITFEISFEPTLEFIVKLYEKVRESYKSPFFLRFNVNKNLFSGAKIEFMGKLFEENLLLKKYSNE